MSDNEEIMKRPKPKMDEIHIEFYDKDEMDKYLDYLEKRHYCLNMKDIKTGKDWDVDFLFCAFPGLQHSGYRAQGYCRTGVKRGCTCSEMREFSTLVLVDGVLKFINW